jgi:hypothetical protein
MSCERRPSASRLTVQSQLRRSRLGQAGRACGRQFSKIPVAAVNVTTNVARNVEGSALLKRENAAPTSSLLQPLPNFSARVFVETLGPELAELIPLWYISASSQILWAKDAVEPMSGRSRTFRQYFRGLSGFCHEFRQG